MVKVITCVFLAFTICIWCARVIAHYMYARTDPGYVWIMNCIIPLPSGAQPENGSSHLVYYNHARRIVVRIAVTRARLSCGVKLDYLLLKRYTREMVQCLRYFQVALNWWGLHTLCQSFISCEQSEISQVERTDFMASLPQFACDEFLF